MASRFPVDEFEIDLEKLSKLEKMIVRVDADIQKMQKDNDKVHLVEMLKKLAEMKLDKFGNIIQQIFLGENTLLNSLLKIKTNLEFNPNKMIENLELLGNRGRRRNSSSQIAKAREDSDLKLDDVKTPIKRKPQARIQKNLDFIQKVFSDKSTDTEEDKNDAKRLSNVIKKAEELDEIRREMDEQAFEMEQFLKDRKFMNFESERSKAESSLKMMLKDLTVKKRRAEQIEREGEDLLQDPKKEAERKAKQAANAALIMGVPPGQKLRDGVLISITNCEVQTDKDPLIEKFEKLSAEIKQKAQKLTEMEKKLKDALRDADIYKESNKKLNDKISEMTYISKKRDEEAKKEKEKKEKTIVMNEKDKDRFKSLVEENYRMKLKLKELVDEIKALDKENKGAMDKFRNFIMNSNLTEEQKRMLLGKVEELFTLDLSKRLNLRELEHMSKIDNEMLKDPFIRSIIGDPIAMVKRIKQEEKDKVKMRASPNYDADFDPNLLEDGQRIITRKVKKKIRRLNSKGEWVEEEIEVEEECVVDKNGNIIRSREKPKDGAVMDPAMQAFINAHGGLAIGGAKFNLPIKPGKPVAKNGQPIKEGEWFIDQNGNRVRMTKNAKGEEEYEIQEEYIDEFGNKQIRNKKVVITKDKDGNEIITEEYIDPITGKKVTVQKKVFKDKDGIEVVEEVTTDEFGRKITKQTRVLKDKDGNEVIEEVTVDAFGRKITKRTKVLKDKDGNEYIEEEIIDEFGNKIIVRKKKMKDANGNDIWVTETINADGSRTIVTEKIGKNGEKIVIEEKIDQFGKKTITEKRIIIGKDGKPIIEEISYDEKGNRIIKNIRQSIDKDGNMVQIEETTDENGNKIIKKTKFILDKDGVSVKVEEIIDANGRKITKFTKQIVDKDGNIITIEETVDEYGNKIIKKIKKTYDKDGNEIIEEEIIDENGNRIIVRTKKNKDGSIEVEHYNPETGERIITKKRVDAHGREIIEETRIDKNGNAVTTTKVITTDKFGNKIVEETYIDPITGEKVTIKKKITYDKDGNEIVEETITDAHGNVKTIKKKTYKDKDGNEITEEEVVGADGKRYKIKTKVYKDADGNEITEEERIDEFGNRIIIRKKKDKDGKEYIEEIRIDKDGNKTIVHKVVHKDGTVEETIIDSKGNITKSKYKKGMSDKDIQVNIATPQDLETMLINLGCSFADAKKIAQAIMDFIHKGTPFLIGDESELDKIRGIKSKHSDLLYNLKEQRKLEMEENRKIREGERIKKIQEIQAQKEGRRKKGVDGDDEEDLEIIDDKMTEQEQLEALYKRMKNKGGAMGELIRNIRNQLGLNGEQEISLDHFKEYMNKFKSVHSKCGENCPHLKRFYAKLGFIQNKYKRRFLKMKDTKINAFQGKSQKLDKLPRINHPSQDFSEGSSSFQTSFYQKDKLNTMNSSDTTNMGRNSVQVNTDDEEDFLDDDQIKGDDDQNQLEQSIYSTSKVETVGSFSQQQANCSHSTSTQRISRKSSRFSQLPA